MAAVRCRPLVPIFIIVILACQIWFGAAYNNQRPDWHSKHLFDVDPSKIVRTRTNRQLQESTTSTGRAGYRATLVNEHHKLHTRYGLNSMERIYFGAQHSRSRAWDLDSNVRAAPYCSDCGTGPLITGRKLLQSAPDPSTAAAPGPSFESPLVAVPASYSMAFTIGTPPRNFTAIADTGSDLVWLQCAGCTVCFNQTAAPFQPSNSSTYADLGCSSACSELGTNEVQCTPQCEYTYEYGDQSTTQGYFSEDTVTLESYNGESSTLVPKFNFGCGLENNVSFEDTDGLVGLGRGPISFPSQIAPYLNNATKFSYCLVDTSNSTASSPIIFGEDAVPTNSSTVYTPLLTPQNAVVTYYYVNLQGISVGGVNLSIPTSALEVDANGKGGCIFDSGTTYTTLTDGAYTPLYNEVVTDITDYRTVDLSQQVGLDLCYDITGATSVEVPYIVFHFENADLNLPVDNIMLFLEDNSGSMYMCLAMMGGSTINIFGSTQQQNFQIVYEVDALQVGWVPEDCATF